MKAAFLTTLLLFASIFTLIAQNLIAVQNGGVPKFFTLLQEAVNNAQNGDTIFIPGGGFDGVTINKKIHLIGVGHHPDSTNVTARTIIPYISLESGADNGSLTGIYFPSTINIVYGNINTNINIIQNISGYSISRCYISKIYDGAIAANFTFNENIIGFLSINGSNISLNNNLIYNSLSVQYGLVKNNIFLFTNGNLYNCLVENNIFNSIFSYNSSSKSIFHNNVKYGVNGILSEYNIQGSGNFLDDVTLQSIFVNFDPTTMTSGEGVYKADFHLLPNSPYKNAGRDGTDIGIYGGAFPWKDGSIPSNPHFQTIKIGPKTDTNGSLNVKIKVAAQDH